MRVVVERLGDASSGNGPIGGIAELAGRLGMTYTLRPFSLPKKVMLLVSKFDHCLADLLNQLNSVSVALTPDIRLAPGHGRVSLLC